MCQAQPTPYCLRDWLLAGKGQRAGAASGHLQDFLAHVDDPEPVPELGEAIQLRVAFLQGHLLFAGQLPAEVLHQLALQRHRGGHVSEAPPRGRQARVSAWSPPTRTWSGSVFSRRGTLIGATPVGVGETFGGSLHLSTTVSWDPASPPLGHNFIIGEGGYISL